MIEEKYKASDFLVYSRYENWKKESISIDYNQNKEVRIAYKGISITFTDQLAEAIGNQLVNYAQKSRLPIEEDN